MTFAHEKLHRTTRNSFHTAICWLWQDVRLFQLFCLVPKPASETEKAKKPNNSCLIVAIEGYSNKELILEKLSLYLGKITSFEQVIPTNQLLVGDRHTTFGDIQVAVLNSGLHKTTSM